MINYTDSIDTTQPGPVVVRGMPSSVYHALPRLNASKVAKFAESTLEGALEMARVTEPSMAMAFGTAVHARILEPQDYLRRVLIREDIGPSAKVGYAKACEEHPDAIVLAKGWAQDIDGIRDGIRRNLFAETLLFNRPESERELTILWTEEVHGTPVPCKARLDFIDPAKRIVADLKTSHDIVPGKFEKTIGDFGYHTKGAWYCRAAERARLVVNPRMVWIACQTDAPFACQAFVGADSMMGQGWSEACLGMHRYVAYTTGGVDPYPPAHLLTVDLPAYKQIPPDMLAQFTAPHEI